MACSCGTPREHVIRHGAPREHVTRWSTSAVMQVESSIRRFVGTTRQRHCVVVGLMTRPAFGRPLAVRTMGLGTGQWSSLVAS